MPLEDITVTYELEVLDEAAKFLTSQNEVDPSRVGIVGHSLGGMIAAWYTAHHPEIRSLVTLSAVYNFLLMWNHYFGAETAAEMKEKGFAMIYSNRLNRKLKMKVGFYEDAQKYNMDEVIDRLTCSVLVIGGTADEAVTLEHAQYYFDKAALSRNKNLKVVKGADHIFSNPEHLNEVAVAIADWFGRTL
jgi:dipeptidyl aminopeptidase/acylaminoacyl peptidase